MLVGVLVLVVPWFIVTVPLPPSSSSESTVGLTPGGTGSIIGFIVIGSVVIGFIVIGCNTTGCSIYMVSSCGWTDNCCWTGCWTGSTATFCVVIVCPLLSLEEDELSSARGVGGGGEL